jgi:hypothetical protein
MRHKQEATARSRLFGAIACARHGWWWQISGALLPRGSSRGPSRHALQRLTFGTHDPETAPRAMLHLFKPKVHASRPATAARRPRDGDGEDREGGAVLGLPSARASDDGRTDVMARRGGERGLFIFSDVKLPTDAWTRAPAPVCTR